MKPGPIPGWPAPGEVSGAVGLYSRRRYLCLPYASPACGSSASLIKYPAPQPTWILGLFMQRCHFIPTRVYISHMSFSPYLNLEARFCLYLPKRVHSYQTVNIVELNEDILGRDMLERLSPQNLPRKSPVDIISSPKSFFSVSRDQVPLLLATCTK